MIKTTTVNLERFKNACGFTLTLACWGNRRKADIAKIETDAQKSRLRLSKELIVAEEYEAIKTYFGALRQWVYGRTVPSFFKEGFQLASLGAVSEIEDKMRVAQGELAALVEKLIGVYPGKVEEARAALNDQFSARDYPQAEDLRGMFAIGWNWLAFSVPENLPAELRAKETEKLEKQFEDASQQITEALRVSFQELIAHATEKLTSEPGEKKKVFRDSLIGNIQEFIDTFNSRNLMNDVELADLVGKAKGILVGANPENLRKFESVRATTAAAFGEIKAKLDTMITEKKTRAIDLSEE